MQNFIVFVFSYRRCKEASALIIIIIIFFFHNVFQWSRKGFDILVIGRISSMYWLCKPWNAVFIEDGRVRQDLQTSCAFTASMKPGQRLWGLWRSNKQNQGNVESRHADISAIYQCHLSFHTNYACRIQAEGRGIQDPPWSMDPKFGRGPIDTLLV